MCNAYILTTCLSRPVLQGSLQHAHDVIRMLHGHHTAPHASQIAVSPCCSQDKPNSACAAQKMNVKLDPEDFNGSKSPPGHQSQQAVYDIAQKYSQLWNNGAPRFRLALYCAGRCT